MKFWTYKEIRDKVTRDLSMEEEIFVTPEELLGYANEAIDEVERQIHMLCEDYFITRQIITIVPGQEEYNIPSDIYGLKIREINYRKGADVFKLKRLKSWHKFSEYEADKANGTTLSGIYGYFIVNSVAGSPKILISPTPSETADLYIWYVRNANTLVDETSICDIPESVNYVIAYMKMKCMEKEFHPNLGKAISDVEYQKQATNASLAEMYADGENEIEPDMRIYNQMTSR